MAKDDMAKKLKAFDKAMTEHLDDTNFQIIPDDQNRFFLLETSGTSMHDQDGLVPNEQDNVIPNVDNMLDDSEGTSDAFDEILSTKFLISEEEEVVLGQCHQIIHEVTDHRADNTAIPKLDGYVNTRSGNRKKITTKGWVFLVELKDGLSDWMSLKVLKESYPVNVAEYITTNQLEAKPAFAWWVHDVLKRHIGSCIK
eukprot:2329240-Ditylum_brightwellii.AAC.2